jgi:tryptophan-rich sensory protein
MRDALQVLAAGAVVIFVFLYPLLWPMNKKKTAFYTAQYHKVPTALPSSVFGPAWFVLYGLISAAMVLHLLSIPLVGTYADDIYTTVLILEMVNVAANHLWSVLFFRMCSPIIAFVDSIVLLGTAVAVAVLYGLESQWLSFGLYVPYAAWLLYAMLLNLMWIIYADNKECLKRGGKGAAAPFLPRGTHRGMDD